LTLLAEALIRLGKLEEVGGYLYLANLETFIISTTAAPQHAAMVHDKAISRRLMLAAEAIIREASEEARPVNEQVELAEKLVFEVSQERQGGEFRVLKDIMQETMAEVADLYHTREGRAGLQTHYPDLDRQLGGIEPSALLILAARPSIGKTAFALNLVRNIAAIGGKPVAFFSLEMSADQLNLRLLSSEARLIGQRIRSGRIREDEFEKLRETASHMQDWPIFIDDTAGISLMQVRSRARRLKRQRPDLALIIVDYMQLMTSPQGRRETSRQEQVAEMSRGLKQLAKELSTPVLALSQLSRSIEQRGGKERGARPMLSDLRESGSIEQDADVVMFVHRERVEQEKDENGQPLQRQLPIPTDIIVGKNRNGPIGDVPMLFLADYTLFVNALGPPAGGG
jgi:replicative DNA helicase